MSKYPDSFELNFSGFTWELKFLGVESENYGLTFTDQKKIHIFTKNKSRQNVLETVVHELHHLLVFDLSQAIFHYEAEKIFEKEENAIRLTSPRLFQLIKDNKPFFDWLFKEIHKL